MPKILVGECKQERFCPSIRSSARMKILDISVGSAILDFHRNVSSEMAGALRVFAQHDDIEIIPFTARRSLRQDRWLRRASPGSGGEFMETVRNCSSMLVNSSTGAVGSGRR